jgi:hypothetical protein
MKEENIGKVGNVVRNLETARHNLQAIQPQYGKRDFEVRFYANVPNKGWCGIQIQGQEIPETVRQVFFALMDIELKKQVDALEAELAEL